MVSINNLISKNPDRYTYQNVGDYFSQKLGIFDTDVRERIEKHLAKIEATDLIKSTKFSLINNNTIVKVTL